MIKIALGKNSGQFQIEPTIEKRCGCSVFSKNIEYDINEKWHSGEVSNIEC